MVVNAGDKPGYISTSIWANDELLSRVVTEKETHDAIPRIVLATTHVINIPSVLRNNSHVLYVPISLDNKSVMAQRSKPPTLGFRKNINKTGVTEKTFKAKHRMHTQTSYHLLNSLCRLLSHYEID